LRRIARDPLASAKKIDKRTLELFRSYRWPGNFRELQNVVGRSVIVSSDGVLCVEAAWLSRASSQLANNLSPQTAMRTPVVNGRSLRTHWRELEGECLARTGPGRGFEYHLRPLEYLIKKLRMHKATSNSAKPFPRTGEIAISSNFTKFTGSFPPFFFRLFNLLRMACLMHLELLKSDITYRLETDDLIMFSDVGKV
jgi:transcriptional regulator with AAA-type ATPase domain